MKRIAVFVEGESEKIFIFNLLLKLFDPSTLKVECIKIYTDDNFLEDNHKHSSPNPEYEFLVINAGNDAKVVSSIYKRAKYMQDLGYSSVIGLRDLYCQEYDKLSPNKIDDAVSNIIISSAKKTITSLNLGSSVNLFFSVMEIEAWYFGFHNALERLGYQIVKINSILGKNILTIDPESEFYKPKKDIERIHKTIKTTPFREVNFAHAISNEVTIPEIKALTSTTKLSYFKLFIEYIESYKN